MPGSLRHNQSRRVGFTTETQRAQSFFLSSPLSGLRASAVKCPKPALPQMPAQCERENDHEEIPYRAR
jgi:hypothetical protein